MSPGAVIALAFWGGLTIVCLIAVAWMVVHAGDEEEMWPSRAERAREEHGGDDFAFGVLIAMDDDPTPAGRRHQ